MMNKPLAVVALATVCASAFAWSDAGHGTIATIAYRHLTPQAKLRFDEYLKIGVSERYHNAIMASYWADEVRPDRAETGPWHYINIHFRTDGRPVTMKPLEQNVVFAVNTFRKVLADGTKTKEARAEAFRWVLHFVGDAHQPLHNVARDTVQFPEGDRGGNDFAIVPGNGLPSWNTNLHSTWDSGCGFFALPMRSWEPGAPQAIAKLADQIEKDYPLSALKAEVADLDPNNWAQEGFKIATSFAYTAPEGGTPSRDYVLKGQDVSKRRAALAGYRLAAILNEALR